MTLKVDKSGHTKIRCGSILVNDLDVSLALYRDVLEQDVVESGELNNKLAESWGAPRLSGAKTCLLQPRSGAQSYLRLIQSPDKVTPVAHATTYGWCAYEICVSDVFALAESLEGTDFKVVGPPKRMDNIANVIPMQVVGPDQEVLFLNQVLESDAHSDLPVAQCTVDQIFIAVLASNNRQQTVANYVQELAGDEAGTYELRYSLINRAFGLDPEVTHKLTLVQDGRTPLLEIDQYPDMAGSRKHAEGNLSHGNTMVSLVVNNLDELPLSNKVSEQPIYSDGLLYAGGRSIVLRGDCGECLELIELPKS